jgi:hypothetical protein
MSNRHGSLYTVGIKPALEVHADESYLTIRWVAVA